MRTIKVVNRTELCKQNQQLVKQVQEMLLGRTSKILEEAKTTLDREDLSDLALTVIDELMEQEIAEIAGKKGQHRPLERKYTRWGTNPGSVAINGQKVFTLIPRALETATKKFYTVQHHNLFQSVSALAKRAYRDLIRGISTRHYQEGISKFLHGYGASASAVSRRMIEVTAEKVKELMERRLDGLDCCVLMIDGIQFGGHTIIIALGIDTKGVKHVLGLWQGATENARVAKSVLEDIIERGLNVDRPFLVVIDGSKALRRAVKDVLGEETPVQRCTIHKKRNVTEQLPEKDRPWVGRRMTKAYQLESAQEAERELTRLADDLERINPSAARSLREGLSETLTLHRLGLPQLLKRTLQSTNLIESLNAVVRERTSNVKNWQSGDQVERWAAAGALEAEKHFHRIHGHDGLPILIDALTKLRTEQSQAA